MWMLHAGDNIVLVINFMGKKWSVGLHNGIYKSNVKLSMPFEPKS